MSKLEKVKNKKIVAKVTPVKEIPEGRKIAKIPEYDAVFKQIIESPEKMFKVEVEGKTVRSHVCAILISELSHTTRNQTENSMQHSECAIKRSILSNWTKKNKAVQSISFPFVRADVNYVGT